MPRVNITEHSDTYSYQVRNASYACVALPICAIWGPAYIAGAPDSNPDWYRFNAGYQGTTDFINTFKGPNMYLGLREKSYDYALKLLAAGYDILVKRVDGLGELAQGTMVIHNSETPAEYEAFKFTAKYPGSYGRKLGIIIRKSEAWNTTVPKSHTGTISVYEVPDAAFSVDTPGILLEIKTVAFHTAAETDAVPLITEVELDYLKHPIIGKGTSLTPVLPNEINWSDVTFPLYTSLVLGGQDYTTTNTAGTAITKADVMALLEERGIVAGTEFTYYDYVASVADVGGTQLQLLYNQQILYSRFMSALDELTDPICYDWDVVFSAIADDQYIPRSYLEANNITTPAYSYTKLMLNMVRVASVSKCGTAFIGTPYGCPRGTYNKDTKESTGAVLFKNKIAQAVINSRDTSARTIAGLGDNYFNTFLEVVGPWCKTTLPTSGETAWVTPELAHLLLIINAQGIGGINKWWMVPAGMTSTGVVHTPEYKIKKAYLDLIQNHDEGICLNPLMEVPGKGFTCFGNSTLWNKPLGTYNALQNLSTRLLCNRVKQRIWDVALQILFKYNNENAYSHFYAGLSPLLDEMRSMGALTGNEYNPYGYKIIMNPDIVNLDRINANTVIGKVYLAVTGVIDTVDVDLFLLPPTGFMESYD